MNSQIKLVDARFIQDTFRISAITLWRWTRPDSPVQFPKPVTAEKHRRLWSFNDVLAFLNRRKVEG